MGLRSSKRFYSCILTSCVTAWYGNCLASDLKALQRVVHTAQYITGAELPAIQDLYTRRCQRKALRNYQKTPATHVIDQGIGIYSPQGPPDWCHSFVPAPANTPDSNYHLITIFSLECSLINQLRLLGMECSPL